MTPDQLNSLGTVITALLVGGGGVGVFAWLRDRAKPEVDRGELELKRQARDYENVQLVIANLKDDLARTRAQGAEDMAQVRREVSELRAEVQAVTEQRDQLRDERNQARDYARAYRHALTAAQINSPLSDPDWI